MDCAPLVFTPLLKVRVWGGELLKSRAPNPPGDPVGESWELADHGADTTVVATGPQAGRSLRELFESNREALCGSAVDPASPAVFPLLLKLIDPTQDLSVQVHPDDAYAGQRQAGELGKTEAWYVLSADPGALLYRGFKPDVTRDDLAQALEAGTVAEILHSFTVRAGDVVYLPSGTVHALGAGVRIAEIQQNSDTTYRVFDWNRVGLDGKPRQLHVEDALAVATIGEDAGPDLCAPTPVVTGPCLHERFVACEKFAFERLGAFRDTVPLETEGARFHILTVTSGTLVVETADGRVELGRWDSCLVPAVAGSYHVSGGEDSEALLFYRP